VVLQLSLLMLLLFLVALLVPGTNCLPLSVLATL